MDSTPETGITVSRRVIDEPQDITLLGLTNILLSQWRLIVLLPILLAVFVIGRSMMSPRSHMTTSTFTPDGVTTSSRISGLAAQFGISVAPPVGVETAEFYRQLLKSREVLRQVALTKYTFRSGTEPGDSVLSGTFPDVTGINAETANMKMLYAIQALEKAISTSLDIESNVITLNVTSRWPDLSLQIHKRVLELADEYNSERRRSQATNERKFVEARLAEARKELNDAERTMEVFLERNRQYGSSPQLVFDHQRLQRQLDQRQQIHMGLSQSLEQARIDEVRNTPVLSLITPPETVIQPVARGTVTKGILALLVGTILACGFAFLRASLERKRVTGAEEYATFVRLSRKVMTDVLRMLPNRVRPSIAKSSTEE